MMFASATFTTILTVVCQAIVAVFAYLLALHNTKNDKKIKKQEKIDEAKKLVSDACDSGSIDDLIDATKKLGDAKKL